MAVMRSDHPLASYDRELSVADLASESWSCTLAQSVVVFLLPASLERLSFEAVRFVSLRDPKAQTAVCLAKRWDDRSTLVRQFFQAATRLKKNETIETGPTEATAKRRRGQKRDASTSRRSLIVCTIQGADATLTEAALRR
jgi:hypothetical protein